MDASSFISASHRFFAIRGPAARLRCDHETNFVGGQSELDDALSEMDLQPTARVAFWWCRNARLEQSAAF